MIDSSELPGDFANPDRNTQVGWGARLHRFRFVIGRYWWIIAICGLIGLGVQGYRCLQEVSRYMSVARLILNGHISMPMGQGGEIYSEDLMLFYGTQVALMNSPDTFAEAVERVRTLHPDIPVDESATVMAFQVPKTSVFELHATSTNPEYAQQLLTAVADTYLANKRGRKDQATDGAVTAITEEVSKLDAETRNDEQQLLDFQKENNVVFIEEQSSNAASYLVGLSNEMARLTKEYDLLNLESQSGTAGTGDGASSGNPSVDGQVQQANASIAAEQENIEKLKILHDEYGVYLKDKHPKMITLTAAIDKEQKFLEILQTRSADAREAHRKDLELQIKNLQQQIADANKKSLDLNQRLEIFQQLKAKINREQTLYNQFASSIQNVDLSKSLDQPDIITMAPASPATLINPGYPRQLAIGLAIGIVAGFMVIYFIQRLDNRINSPLDFEENFDVPLLGQLPRTAVESRTKRVPLLSKNDQRHVFGESNRSIRSSILFRSSKMINIRSLLVTSAQPGDGKSTLASNLAISFALSGTRTLLIDADLRRGVLHTLFATPTSMGLSEYLQHELGWRDAVQSTHVSNLHLMVRGKVPEQAGDLLLSPAMDLLMHESISEYDLVMWDTAPILAADDAANLCSKVSGVVFVLRVGHSPIDSVRTALDELSQRSANIVGVVVNGVEPKQPGYHNKYRYKGYYKLPAEA